MKWEGTEIAKQQIAHLKTFSLIIQTWKKLSLPPIYRLAIKRTRSRTADASRISGLKMIKGGKCRSHWPDLEQTRQEKKGLVDKETVRFSSNVLSSSSVRFMPLLAINVLMSANGCREFVPTVRAGEWWTKRPEDSLYCPQNCTALTNNPWNFVSSWPCFLQTRRLPQ